MTKENKTVWILGAGASMSNNFEFPNINQIFAKAKEYSIISLNVKTLKDDYKELSEFIVNCFNKSLLRTSDKIDVEKVMTFLQIEFEKKGSYSNLQLMDKVIFLIRHVLSECLVRGNSNEEYEHLVNNFLNRNTSIISFNWDIALDQLIKSNNIYENFLKQISSKFTEGFFNGYIPFPYKEFPTDTGIYLKMHGSVDWLYCPNQQCRVNNRLYVLEDSILESHYCSECHEECKILIIPPLLNKNYDKYPSIKKIWNRSFLELNNASEVIIWGYGVPPTDFYSNWLLTRSIPHETIIKIINPECLRISNHENELQEYSINKTFVNKFKEIFSRQKITFYYNYKDFKNNFDINQKYNVKV
ncbi:hypothetical protein ND861_18995 [Leptospira sp. 2 VSF19]|uniref:Deacetylase sirtuin-type domain-containing protein n=1 Tax=Leptospira soteropolitanensis TaxID=2950025 RepID=A0AAW5VTT9_9LEPT|nr:hypothetical protein [Leptospira soteropolitanensis]MCW7494777.1 hypothetical protein [Leptospira soteropolitanensis]MCW7502356.1 hypothetical protein [Leptospira soteropolitanensis]MCW7524582.1 hypothetical protein [Leptospira soteropolitanensis]MCW7528452.1 hypothetical protein [Leptospira soteropolitanensis]MCW7532322.1 hypothetical protein [Leptospira soteropolitanensis]